jgi:hypothetical protein
LAGYNPLKLLNDWDTIKNKTQPLHPSDDTGRRRPQEFDTLKKIFIFTQESTTTRTAGGSDFTAIGGERQGREVPQSLRVKPGAKDPVWKTQLCHLNLKPFKDLNRGRKKSC